MSNGGSIARLVLGGLVAVLVPLGLGAANAQAGARVIEHRDVAYGSDVALDVFQPDQTDGPVPAVLLVHGGGWRSGDKDSWADEARSLVAGTGWVAVTVDYDLDAAEPYVTQPDDVRRAIEWVRANAAGLGVDPDRIGLLGSSAGGHLSMLVATTTGGVRAVVSWAGPSDLPRLATAAGADPLVRDLAVRYNGAALDDAPTRWIDGSPVAHVDPADPPMLLVHAAGDPVVLVDQLDAMRDALVDNGVEVDTLVFPGRAHASELKERAWGRSVGFLRDHLED